MIEQTTLVPSPPADLRFRFRFRFVTWFGELWQSRELLWTLTKRELLARYKQASLGFAWAIITPVALMVVFSLFFQRIAKVNTQGSSYQLFTYLGLLPWTFFSSSLSTGGQSLLMNKQLLNRIYCPREVFPISSVGVAGVDTALAMVALTVLFAIDGTAPRATAVWVPVLLAIMIAYTIGMTLLVSAIMVYLRDVRHGLPLILQLGLFATPVAYGIEAIPTKARTAYAAANPLAGVIDGLRRSVLQGHPPRWNIVLPGVITSVVVVIVGFVLFKRMEVGFADIA